MENPGPYFDHTYATCSLSFEQLRESPRTQMDREARELSGKPPVGKETRPDRMPPKPRVAQPYKSEF